MSPVPAKNYQSFFSATMCNWMDGTQATDLFHYINIAYITY